jgi:hypothetical protein
MAAPRSPIGRKGGPKQAARKTFALQERRAKVAEMYRAWRTQAEIALACGISQRTVSDDLAVIHEEYKLRYAKAFRDYAVSELARLDQREAQHQLIYDQAMAAWEASKGQQRRTRRIVEQREGQLVPVSGYVDEEMSHGDPRYLMTANRAVDSIREIVRLRCDLLGLYADKNLPPGEADEREHQRQLAERSDEELLGRIGEIQRLLVAGGDAS